MNNLTEKENRIDLNLDPTVTAIKNQAINPPGGDLYIGAFYSAFYDLLNAGSPEAVYLITEVKEKRQITPSFHTNLLFRAFQAVLMADPNYPFGYQSKSEWTTHLKRTLDSSDVLDRIIKSLIENDTTTTVYQRYLGEFAFAEHLAAGAEINIIDLGCGGNYGVPGMQIGESFQAIIDKTPGQFINGKLNRRLHVKEGWALDRQNPYKPESIMWRHSCGHYPSELANGGLNKTLALEKRLAQANTTFKQEDLLDISGSVPRGYFDFAIINTMLYQLPPKEQALAIANARELLTSKGWLFIQDFAIPDPNDHSKLVFEGVEWGVKGNYRLFVTTKTFGSQIYEIIRWNNGRCTEAIEGIDFEKIINS